jgi:hypothetical protein
MTLGKQLQATITELEQAKIKNMEAHRHVMLAADRKARTAYLQWLEHTRDTIVDQIMLDSVPSVTVCDFERGIWLGYAQQRIARNQDLWDAFVQYFLIEELTVVVHNEHLGGGMHSWKTITVFPIAS